MCRDLDDLKDALSTFAKGFDAHSITPSEAASVVRICSRMEASIASVKMLAAARAAESSSWKLEGYRSAADQLAHQSGMSPGAARRALDTGRRMSDQPEVAQAALAGDLTAEQAAAVSDGAAADPGQAHDLIERAKHATIPELNEEVARIKSENTDLEARRRAIHARRSLKRWTGRDGAGQAHMYGNPEDVAAVWQALDPIRRRLIMARRGSQPNEPLEAIDYDALVTMARIAAGQDADLTFQDLVDIGLFPQAGAARSSQEKPAPTKKLAGSPAKVIIRVDLDALLRGWPTGGELCQMDGCGPIPVSLIEQLFANDATLIALALTRGTRVESVYHHGRRPNAFQKTALDLLYPTCAVAGCNARAGLQSDHRIDWAKTKFTALHLIDRLCAHHHKLKTHHDWALVEGIGKRAFVPPDDPRHPANAPPP